MPYRTIVAAFFFRDGEAARRPEPLLEKAGVTSVELLGTDSREALGLGFSDPPAFSGCWGVFGKVWAIVDSVGQTGCLQLYAKFDTFIDACLRDDAAPDAPDGAMGYAQQFGDACMRLDPAVAFVDAHSHYDDPHWVEKEGNRAWVMAHCGLIAEGDVNALADLRLSMLYVPERLTYAWIDDGRREIRDLLDLPAGRLFFAGSGPSRMT